MGVRRSAGRRRRTLRRRWHDRTTFPECSAWEVRHLAIAFLRAASGASLLGAGRYRRSAQAPPAASLRAARGPGPAMPTQRPRAVTVSAPWRRRMCRARNGCLLNRSDQYGVRVLWAEPLTGSSGTPRAGPKTGRRSRRRHPFRFLGAVAATALGIRGQAAARTWASGRCRKAAMAAGDQPHARTSRRTMASSSLRHGRSMCRRCSAGVTPTAVSAWTCSLVHRCCAAAASRASLFSASEGAAAGSPRWAGMWHHRSGLRRRGTSSLCGGWAGRRTSGTASCWCRPIPGRAGSARSDPERGSDLAQDRRDDRRDQKGRRASPVRHRSRPTPRSCCPPAHQLLHSSGHC